MSTRCCDCDARHSELPFFDVVQGCVDFGKEFNGEDEVPLDAAARDVPLLLGCWENGELDIGRN